MVRRVGFAQCLINDPDVVIMDEPTSGLDPISSRQIKDLLLELKAKGKTVLLSSHLLADVQDVCDRICLLHQGRTLKYDSVKNILVQRDSVSLTFKDLKEETRLKIEGLAAAEGARLVKSEHSLETLEDVFLRTVSESGDGLKYERKPEGGAKPP
jgi:ABC-2 type transport system ATP-binding protein